MGKNANFTGQPIFSQVLSLINRSDINRCVRDHNSDKYYKKFKTREHLITMLYAIFHKCTSIREVTTGMQVCAQKLNHLGMVYCPRRSTLSDANKKRNSEVFASIYKTLYSNYHKSLPDSRKRKKWNKRLYIVDSTTITLFKEILKATGLCTANGKRKGGIKVHALVKSDEDVPCLVRMNAAASHDSPFIKGLKLPQGAIVVFDKGYNNYSQYNLWTQQKVSWITRLIKRSTITKSKQCNVSSHQKAKGIFSDEQIILGHSFQKNSTKVRARLIRYHDNTTGKSLSFITNNFHFSSVTIAKIYKQRWQIETLFKRLKQNYPIQYFLGDNENAIRIQIWCALIADLLIKIIQKTLNKKWAFANLSSMLRIHLMTYTKLFDFLENPEKQLINYTSIDNKGPTLLFS